MSLTSLVLKHAKPEEPLQTLAQQASALYIKQAARILGVDQGALRHLIISGQLTAVRQSATAEIMVNLEDARKALKAAGYGGF